MTHKRTYADTRAYEAPEHLAYRGYLIRWSIFTLDKPDSKYWIEKENHFIAWAFSIDEAKRTIDTLT